MKQNWARFVLVVSDFGLKQLFNPTFALYSISGLILVLLWEDLSFKAKVLFNLVSPSLAGILTY
jgi:hypothetical protein